MNEVPKTWRGLEEVETEQPRCDDSHVDRLVKCDCEREWPFASEQAASVDLYGKCIVCRRLDMTKSELAKITETAKSRGAYT